MSVYGQAVALPRRRKRRKPDPLERLCIICFAVQVLGIVAFDGGAAAAGASPLSVAIGVGVNVIVVRLSSWPAVWHYIVNGWEDER